MFSEFSLVDNFEVKGHWWLPPSLSSCHSRRWAMSRAVETWGAVPRRLGGGFWDPADVYGSDVTEHGRPCASILGPTRWATSVRIGRSSVASGWRSPSRATCRPLRPPDNTATLCLALVPRRAPRATPL